jgi:EpsI family protein
VAIQTHGIQEIVMKKRRGSIHAVIAIAVLALVTANHHVVRMAYAQAYQNMTEGAATAISDRIGGYVKEGEDTEIPQDWMDTLQTKNILMRNYRAPSGRYVQLTVVMAGASRRSLHFPEVCLRGQGWEIREQYTAPVGVSFMAKRLVLVKGKSNEAVMYWFKVGDRFTDNFFVNSMHWALGQITFRPAKSGMIRVSTFIGPGGEESAFADLENFSELLGPELLEVL